MIIYFKRSDFNITSFVEKLKLPKWKQDRIKNIYEEQTSRFIKQWNNEEIIDVDQLIELIGEIKKLKR